ncbi:hypothetical protein [Dysgonomonas sp. 25]|uniref:hypothetical protein n=1 Tax=Dysgonomonas sp. 25 TaxID=2302933 RepID=UPI001C87049A|nr:hypothetical protein [Dysgonomonas sp. 25]
MKKLCYMAIVALSVLLLSSCTYRIVDFTIISTKNFDLSRAGSFYKGTNRIEGEDKKYIIIIIPTGIPNMKTAIDNTIEKCPGAVALVDGVVYSKSWWFLLYGEESYIVEGTPLIDPQLAGNEELPDFMYMELDKQGNVKKQQELSEQEYLTLRTKLIKSDNKKPLEELN